MNSTNIDIYVNFKIDPPENLPTAFCTAAIWAKTSPEYLGKEYYHMLQKPMESMTTQGWIG